MERLFEEPPRKEETIKLEVTVDRSYRQSRDWTLGTWLDTPSGSLSTAALVLGVGQQSL